MILDKIINNKKKEIAFLKKARPLPVLKKELSSFKFRKNIFLKALKCAKTIAVIAEIKRRSPSKGILRKNFKPLEIAKEYERAHASALSILTDRKFFGGSSAIFKSVRCVTKLPMLRKDFILEEYQVYESRLMGADAILLIAGILSFGQLRSLSRSAQRLGLDCLYEVHTPNEVKKILPLKPKIVGINNRNLRTFKVDIHTTKRLIKKLPKSAFVVSESGIQSHEDLVYLKKMGVKAALVGESLMKQKSPGAALQKLLGDLRG